MGKYVEFLKLCIPYMANSADIRTRFFESTNLSNRLNELCIHASPDKQEEMNDIKQTILKQQNDIRGECKELAKELNKFIQNQESIQVDENFIEAIQGFFQALANPLLQDLSVDLSWQNQIAKEMQEEFVRDVVTSYFFRISCEWHDLVKEGNQFRSTTILWFLRKILSNGFCFEECLAENHNVKEIIIMKKPDEVLKIILEEAKTKDSDFKHLLLLFSPDLQKSLSCLVMLRAQLTVVKSTFQREFEEQNKKLSKDDLEKKLLEKNKNLFGITQEINDYEIRFNQLLNELSKSSQCFLPKALDNNQSLNNLIRQGSELFEKSFVIVEKKYKQLEEAELKLQKKSAGRRHHSDKEISLSQFANDNKKEGLFRSFSFIKSSSKNNGKEEVVANSLATNKETLFSEKRPKKTSLQVLREALDMLKPYRPLSNKTCIQKLT